MMLHYKARKDFKVQLVYAFSDQISVIVLISEESFL